MNEVAFEGTARIASGSVPTDAVAAYDIRVAGGRLRLALHASTGTVLDVPLQRVTVRPLGRAGTAIVEIDGAPLVVDLSRSSAPPSTAASAQSMATPGGRSLVRTARRVGPALRGRLLRGRFTSALRADA